MPGQSQVGKVFAQVMHDHNLVCNQLLYVPVHYFKRFSSYPCMINDPVFAFRLESFNFVLTS